MHDDNETPNITPANGKDAFLQNLFAEAEVDLSIHEMESDQFKAQVTRKVKLAAWQDRALKGIIVKSGWKPLLATIAAAILQYVASPLIAVLEAPIIVMESSTIAMLLAPLNSGAFIAAIMLLTLRKFVMKMGLFG